MGVLTWSKAGRGCVRGALILAPLLLVACAEVDKRLLEEAAGDGDGDTGGGDGDAMVGDGDGDAVVGDGDGDGDAVVGDGDGDAAMNDCMANPDNEMCPFICREVCNDIDDDCDGEVDENSPDDPVCALENAEALCVRGECVVIMCEPGFDDCDAVEDNGCEVDLDDPSTCGGCDSACLYATMVAGCDAQTCVPLGCLNGLDDCDNDPAECETSVTTLDNCGGCGALCDGLANALPQCDLGVCDVASCIGDFADCTNEEGCETPTTDINNCGGCGMVCELVGSGESCSSGACLTDGACDPGFADCDGSDLTACVRVDTDEHCGACNEACTVDDLENVQSAGCAAGSCEFACQAGFDDCDGPGGIDGCEQALRTLTNCGACGVQCSLANAAATCDDGSCGIDTCTGLYASCDDDDTNGCEQRLNDPSHCGACNNVCPNNEPFCVGGRCAEEACPEPTADCDSDLMGTCETDLSQIDDCGACDIGCAFDGNISPHASLSCAETNSTPGMKEWGCAISCDSGWEDCDGNYANGCEVDLSSPSNCGGCGNTCNVDRGTAACQNGTCINAGCDPDWDDCDNDPLTCDTFINDTNNCGGCGITCNFAFSVGICGGAEGSRACEIASCNPSYRDDCDGNINTGCESDSRNDDNNCNSCGNDCGGLPGVNTAHCSASTCVVDTCNNNRADCNQGPGCETYLTDASSCGSCNNDCTGIPNTVSVSCVDNGGLECRIDTCSPGLRSCDGNTGNGCETNIDNDESNCGGCAGVDNEPCSSLPHTTGSTCSGGSCQIDGCIAPWEDCNGLVADGCELDSSAQSCCDVLADRDGDGVNDCDDGCPDDAGFAAPTDCGCPSAPAAAGTACADDPCGIAAQCDGDATCGDVSACQPTGTCTFVRDPALPSVGYWFCSTGQNWSNGQSRCRGAGPGWDYVTIDSSQENSFVQANRGGDWWIGASDGGNEGNWRWSRDNIQFWQGQSSGSTVGGLYANWDGSNPSGDGLLGLSPKDCAYIESDGQWDDTSCGNSRGYICEGPADACPFSHKVLPGICGCDTADTDSDGDGVADCNDGCPDDSSLSVPGACGCPSTPAPQGTPCTDNCGLSNTCDNAGICGDPSSCIPPGTCTFHTYGGMSSSGYWYCTNTVNWTTAEANCASINAHLVRVNDVQENDFLWPIQAGADAFMGANDRASEDNWVWHDGSNFWDGEENGSAQNGLYNNWNAGEPNDSSGQDCGQIYANGTWDDQDCGSSLPYWCEVP